MCMYVYVSLAAGDLHGAEDVGEGLREPLLLRYITLYYITLHDSRLYYVNITLRHCILHYILSCHTA